MSGLIRASDAGAQSPAVIGALARFAENNNNRNVATTGRNLTTGYTIYGPDGNRGRLGGPMTGGGPVYDAVWTEVAKNSAQTVALLRQEVDATRALGRGGYAPWMFGGGGGGGGGVPPSPTGPAGFGMGPGGLTGTGGGAAPFWFPGVGGGGGGGRGGGGGGGGGGGVGGGGGGSGGGGNWLGNFKGGVVPGVRSTLDNVLPGWLSGLLDVATAIAFVPQEMRAGVESAVGSSSMAMDFIRGTGGLAAPGNADVTRLRSNLGWDATNIPSWMKKLGVTPMEAKESAQRFGIVQADGGADVARSMAWIDNLTTFRGMPAGQMQASAAQSAAYGLIQPNGSGIKTFGAEMEPVFARAVELGVNRSDLTKNIDQWVASSAGGLNTLSKGTIGNFMMDFAGLSGGPSGAAGLQVLKGMSGAVDLIGTNPLQSILAGSVVSKMKNEGDLKAWMDKAQPGLWDTLKADPTSNTMLSHVVQSIQGGDYTGAMAGLGQLVKGQPAEWSLLGGGNPVLGNLAHGFGPASGDIVKANAMGITVPQYIAAGQAASERGAVPKASALVARLMKDLGVTREGAIGMVGNLMFESSNLDPNSTNPRSGATGYANWLDTKGSPRKSRFLAFRAAHPELSPDEANTQFLELELRRPDFAGVLSDLRNPNLSVRQQALGVVSNYIKPEKETYGLHVGRAIRLAGNMQKQGIISDPMNVGENDPELNKVNTVHTDAGVISLTSSWVSLTETFIVVDKALIQLVSAVESTISKLQQQGSNKSPSAPVGPRRAQGWDPVDEIAKGINAPQ